MRIARMAGGIVASCAATLVARGGARADEARGPELGNNRYTALLETSADTDDYVAVLAKGDRISATVAAASGSAVVPAIALVGPDGTVADVTAFVSVRGRKAVLKAYTAPAAGRWAVRIGAASGDGSYSAAFAVTPAPKPPKTTLRLGGAAPQTATFAFEAAAGSAVTVSLKTKGRGAPAALLALTNPDGGAVGGFANAVETKGATQTIRGLALGARSGTYHVDVGAAEADTVASLAVTVTPPERSRAKLALPAEPILFGTAEPLTGTGGQTVRFAGEGISALLPRPKVWIGDRAAAVVGVGTRGEFVDVLVPVAPGGTLASVTLQNPDGQTATRASLFRYGTVAALDLASLEPSYVRILPGGVQEFTVTLNQVPAPPGVDVTLTTVGAFGTVPPSVHVPGNAASATFTVAAGQSFTSGELRATLVSTLTADVGVVPPGAVASIEPAAVTVEENAKQTFTVTLSSPAPSSGADVALDIPAWIGTGPATVHVPALQSSGTFDLVAAGKRAVGPVKATLGASATATVTVTGASTMDLSGYRVVQQYSSATFEIPPGTVLAIGDCIVIGRNTSAFNFQQQWGVVFTSQVHYFSAPDFPDIDGYETIQLRDGNNVSVDGPTIQMAQNGGFIYGRKVDQPANLYASWLAYALNGSQGGLPTSGQVPSQGYPGVYISKFSDALPGRSDFVEIYLDRLP